MKFKCNDCGGKWFTIKHVQAEEAETGLMDKFPNIHNIGWSYNDPKLMYYATCQKCRKTWGENSMVELRERMADEGILK